MIRLLVVVGMVFFMLPSDAEVTCKYCGQTRQNVLALVSAACPRHLAGGEQG